MFMLEFLQAKWRWRRAVFAGVLVSLSMVLVLGCGDSESQIPVYPVRGSVSVAGRAVGGVHLQFHPVNSEHQIFPRAVTDQDGKFELSTYAENDGIPAGDYVVTASWKQLEPTEDAESHPDELTSAEELLDAVFTDPERSGLSVTVVAGRNDLTPFVIGLATKKHRRRKRD